MKCLGEPDHFMINLRHDEYFGKIAKPYLYLKT